MDVRYRTIRACRDVDLRRRRGVWPVLLLGVVDVPRRREQRTGRQSKLVYLGRSGARSTRIWR